MANKVEEISCDGYLAFREGPAPLQLPPEERDGIPSCDAGCKVYSDGWAHYHTCQYVAWYQRRPKWELDRVKPQIKEHDSGLALTHNMPCAVLYEDNQPAVYERKTGIFHPSWKAHTKGWRLVHAENWLQRLILRIFFGPRLR